MNKRQRATCPICGGLAYPEVAPGTVSLRVIIGVRTVIDVELCKNCGCRLMSLRGLGAYVSRALAEVMT